MIYVETSVLVALHTDERFTSSVSHWYANLRGTVLATADCTVTEFASALEQKKRTGELGTAEARRIWRHFEDQCVEDVRLLPVERDLYAVASSLIQGTTFGLRAGDALHLAVAWRSATDAFATLDIVLQKTAGAKQMQVVAFVDPFGTVAKTRKARPRR